MSRARVPLIHKPIAFATFSAHPRTSHVLRERSKPHSDKKTGDPRRPPAFPSCRWCLAHYLCVRLTSTVAFTCAFEWCFEWCFDLCFEWCFGRGHAPSLSPCARWAATAL